MKRYKIVCSKGVLKGACTEAMAELKAKKIFQKYPDVSKICMTKKERQYTRLLKENESNYIEF